MARITLSQQLATAQARIAELEALLTGKDEFITELKEELVRQREQIEARDVRIANAIAYFKQQKQQQAEQQQALATHPALRTERVAASRAKTVTRPAYQPEAWQVARRIAMDNARQAAMATGRSVKLTDHLNANTN